ncbi:MAG: DUF4271 domain-containing protein [Paludibacter sp.]|nr:DUF4271 domain-containing protein [Paludibacter sp.]
MPLVDSLNINDTISAVADTVAIMQDTTIVKDTIVPLDTIPIKIVQGLEGFVHPSLPGTEPWVFGILLFLLLAFSVVMLRASDWLVESVTHFFQIKERSSIFSKNTSNNATIQFILILFSIIVLSLWAFKINFTESSGFHINTFLKYLLVTGSFVGLKIGSFSILGYVFMDNATLKHARDSYINMLIFLSILLFFTFSISIYSQSQFSQIVNVVSLFFCGLAAILMIIKLFQIFFHKIIASFYILLYLCTLEILPLIFLFKAFRLLI